MHRLRLGIVGEAIAYLVKIFISNEGKAELGTASKDTGDASLEQRFRTLLPD